MMDNTDGTREMAQKIASSTEKRGECVVWTGAHNEHGYGLVRIGGRLWKAHRVSYTLRNGEIGPGLVIDHTCHNPACINTDHLQAVTRRQNQENRLGATRASKTGIRGVTWDSKRGAFRGFVGHIGKTHWAGDFRTAAEAEAAVIELRRKLHSNSLMDAAVAEAG